MEVELEHLKEDNHKLRLQIDSLKKTKSVELEYLREEVHIKDSEIKTRTEKHKTEFKAREKELLERVNAVTEEAHQSREEIQRLKETIDKLNKNNEFLKLTQLERHSRLENYEASRINNEQLTQDLKSKSVLLEKQQTKVNQLTTINEELRKSNGVLKEELEGAKSCISDLQRGMKEMEKEHQEDIVGLQQQILQQNASEANDPNKRGNSLFSEIEERRLRVEEELNRLRARVAKLTAENSELQNSLERGDHRSSIIANQLQLIQKSEADLLQELKKLKAENYHLFDTYRDRLEGLRNEYRKKLLQYRDGKAGHDLEEVEILRNERDRLISTNMSLEQHLFDLRRDLKYAKQQQIHFEANFKIVKTKLQAAQEQINKDNKQVNALEKKSSLDSSSPKINKSILEESKLNIDLNAAEMATASSVSNSGSVNKTTPKIKTAAKSGKLQTEEISDCKTQ